MAVVDIDTRKKKVPASDAGNHIEIPLANINNNAYRTCSAENRLPPSLDHVTKMF